MLGPQGEKQESEQWTSSRSRICFLRRGSYHFSNVCLAWKFPKIQVSWALAGHFTTTSIMNTCNHKWLVCRVGLLVSHSCYRAVSFFVCFLFIYCVPIRNTLRLSVIFIDRRRGFGERRHVVLLTKWLKLLKAPLNGGCVRFSQFCVSAFIYASLQHPSAGLFTLLTLCHLSSNNW